jgi:inositol phosphorylceramide synthase catalytic subunit
MLEPASNVLEPAADAAVPRAPTAARALMTFREWLLPSRTMRRRAWPPLLGVAYVAAVAALGGLTKEHVLLGALGLLDLYNERSRQFLRTFFPFILTGAIFDSMRYYYVPLVEGRVHTLEPYHLDAALFGVGGRPLNELFLEHHSVVLDVLCGFGYLCYVAEFFLLALYLFLRGRRDRAFTFGVCFLVVNVMGWITYFVYPAAPPWYVLEHGFGAARMDVGMNAAAALRFDALLGTSVFARLYGRGFTTFGALPSLHAAYPFVAAILAFRFAELRWARVPAVLFFLLICLSAVYLQHHYVIDVLLGALYAAVTVALVVAWQRRRAAHGS